jgi:hypothetical protein
MLINVEKILFVLMLVNDENYLLALMFNFLDIDKCWEIINCIDVGKWW